MPVVRKSLPEEGLYAFTVTPNVSTSGLTVKAYLIGRNGVPIEVGSASGVGANDALAITLDLSVAGVNGGSSYRLEVVGDPTGTNPVTVLPNATYAEYWIDVFQVESITDD
jgi:hypothetical protein